MVSRKMQKTNVVIVYDQMAEKSSDPDHRDVLEQVGAVGDVLGAMGYAPVELGLTLDLSAIQKVLKDLSPAFVFNLVESLEGSGRLIHLVPTALEFHKIPYTGAPADALYQTSNKAVSKKLLQGSDLPTPEAVFQEDSLTGPSPGKGDSYIIKSVWEHASIGIEEDSVVTVQDKEHLYEAMAVRRKALGGSCFAERYIEGREFNLSLLASPNGPLLLPPAEIRFDHFPPEKRKIVGYKAKWDTESFEYHHTPRCFQFPREDKPLLKQMGELTVKCWNLFGIRGYARVDFRVDRENRPWILEVNANPCLSPDAGFAAAAAEADLAFRDVVERIVLDRG